MNCASGFVIRLPTANINACRAMTATGVLLGKGD